MSIEDQQKNIHSVLDQLKPNDTIMWNNTKGDEYQMKVAPSKEKDELSHLKEHVTEIKEISHFGFTCTPN